MKIVKNMNIKVLILVLVLTSILFFLVFPPKNLSDIEVRVTALTFFCIVLWATNIISPLLTSLLFFLFAIVFSVAPPEIIFSGFSSPAEWLTFGGLVIGIGINCSGIGERIANILVKRVRTNYKTLIILLVLMGMIFGLIMPSATGRILLLVPFVLVLSRRFSFDNGTNGRIGMVLSIILGSYIPSFSILTANAPNIILAGMSESIFDITFSYSEYFLLHFPVLGLLKGGVIILLILYFYPDRIDKNKIANTTVERPFTRNEIMLSVVLLALFVLWTTDFVHHISPAWIALGGAIFLLLPKIGIINPHEFNTGIRIEPLLFVAAILGFGKMISYSGVGEQLADGLLSFFPLDEGKNFQNYMSLNLVSMLTGTITTLPGIPAVLTPLADNFTLASGLHLKTVLMTQVSGFSTVFFPYQAPPILIGILISGEKVSSVLTILILLAMITIVLLLPLNYLWWQVLGWL